MFRRGRNVIFCLRKVIFALRASDMLRCAERYGRNLPEANFGFNEILS